MFAQISTTLVMVYMDFIQIGFGMVAVDNKHSFDPNIDFAPAEM